MYNLKRTNKIVLSTMLRKHNLMLKTFIVFAEAEDNQAQGRKFSTRLDSKNNLQQSLLHSSA